LELQQQGVEIISVELTHRSKDYKTLFQKGNEDICLVFGNEVNGVRQKILDVSDEIIMIPMLGKKESLNVSVAAGIVMYATV